DNKFSKYPLTPNAQEPDRFLYSILNDNPDFNNLDALSSQIENGTLKFIKDTQDFLTKHQKP
ncbi:MAG TPA: hypothetical protein VLH35_01940, partial [Candidatus Acidoferrales bacterium]|nr:hypothetical protein [Candidatus Acidoferrales bacterium]